MKFRGQTKKNQEKLLFFSLVGGPQRYCADWTAPSESGPGSGGGLAAGARARGFVPPRTSPLTTFKLGSFNHVTSAARLPTHSCQPCPPGGPPRASGRATAAGPGGEAA